MVDKSGQPTTDTAAFYDGGALTTFGGHKGFGLSVMAELMAGMLSGTGLSSDPDYSNGNGTMLLAIDVGRFLPASDFMEQADALEGRLHAAPTAAGFDAWPNRRSKWSSGAAAARRSCTSTSTTSSRSTTASGTRKAITLSAQPPMCCAPVCATATVMHDRAARRALADDVLAFAERWR